MLRLRPTAISLTRGDIAEVVHRRRFRKFLECTDDDACLAFTPAETEAIRSAALSQPSSSIIMSREPTPSLFRNTTDISPSPSCHRAQPLAADLPFLSFSDKGPCEDVTPLPDTADGRDRLVEVDDPGQSSKWTPQLCLRPRRRSSTALTTVVNTGVDGSADARHLLERPEAEPLTGEQGNDQGDRTAEGTVSPSWLQHPRSSFLSEHSLAQLKPANRTKAQGGARSKSEGGPSTPQRFPSQGSSIHPPSSPAVSHLAPGRFVEMDPPAPQTSGRPSYSRTAGKLRIYNDQLPASHQPQTPQNLPEARHQSRLRGAFTVPARINSPQQAWTPTPTRSRRGFGAPRQPSPSGLRTPGFMGLYGGTENLDDTELVDSEEMEEITRRA